MAMHVSCQGCKHAVQDAPYGIPATCCACKAYDGWTPVDPPTQEQGTDPRYDGPESTTSVDPPVPGQALEFGPAWAEAKAKSRELFERFKDMSEQERARLAAALGAPEHAAVPGDAVGPVDSKIAHGSRKSEPFRRALTDVWRVSLFGERKHGANNWQSAVAEGMHFYEDALWRHLQARRMGEVCADDSGLPHLAHLAWNALMLLEMEDRGVTNPEWGPSQDTDCVGCAHRQRPDTEPPCADCELVPTNYEPEEP